MIHSDELMLVATIAKETSMPDPVRLTIQLGTPENRRLIRARADDGVPAAQRIRALVRLWRDEELVRAQIDDLARQQQLAGRAKAGQTPETSKITVQLDGDLNTALWDARSRDGISLAKRVRAAVQLWSSDVAFGTQVDALAASLHAEQRAKKVAA